MCGSELVRRVHVGLRIFSGAGNSTLCSRLCSWMQLDAARYGEVIAQFKDTKIVEQLYGRMVAEVILHGCDRSGFIPNEHTNLNFLCRS